MRRGWIARQSARTASSARRAASCSFTRSLAAAKTIFTDTDDYTAVTATSLTATEPSLSYRAAGDSTGPTNVAFDVAGTADEIIDLAALSESGTCYHLEDDATRGTFYGSNTTGATNCAGVDANGVTGTSW